LKHIAKLIDSEFNIADFKSSDWKTKCRTSGDILVFLCILQFDWYVS